MDGIQPPFAAVWTHERQACIRRRLADGADLYRQEGPRSSSWFPIPWQEVELSDFAGKKVVLYFYPKDNTPGCTREACGFRDSLVALQKMGCGAGVSRDSAASHQKFNAKFDLPFALLSDPDKDVRSTAPGARR